MLWLTLNNSISLFSPLFQQCTVETMYIDLHCILKFSVSMSFVLLPKQNKKNLMTILSNLLQSLFIKIPWWKNSILLKKESKIKCFYSFTITVFLQKNTNMYFMYTHHVCLKYLFAFPISKKCQRKKDCCVLQIA